MPARDHCASKEPTRVALAERTVLLCGRLPLPPAADICEQLKRSLKFDLQKAEFVSDAEANRLRSRAMRAPWQV